MEEVQDKGFQRFIDVIDSALILATADKVTNTFSDSEMMPES